MSPLSTLILTEFEKEKRKQCVKHVLPKDLPIDHIASEIYMLDWYIWCILKLLSNHKANLTLFFWTSGSSFLTIFWEDLLFQFISNESFCQFPTIKLPSGFVKYPSPYLYKRMNTLYHLRIILRKTDHRTRYIFLFHFSYCFHRILHMYLHWSDFVFRIQLSDHA